MGATQGPEREGKSLDEALRHPAAPTSPTGCLGGRSSVAGSCRGCVAERFSAWIGLRYVSLLLRSREGRQVGEKKG